MTKEKLQERIDRLEQDKEMHKQNFLACEGAIQDCKFWLQQEDTEQQEVKE